MLQFVTSGRFEPLSGRIGIDVTMAFHKWLARALLLAVILHPLFFLGPDLFLDPGRAWSMLSHMLGAHAIRRASSPWPGGGHYGNGADAQPPAHAL